jgi:hypothetical protein
LVVGPVEHAVQQSNEENAVAGPPTEHRQQRTDQQAELEAEGGSQ